MYLIRIKIKAEAQQDKKRLEAHKVWFTKHFEQGDFLIVGPSQTFEMAGVIIARAQSLAALNEILAGDAYYPNLADYEVKTFTPAMVASNIADV
ncbi:YciI family protein [Agrilactobacillus yilanensis]|uniref:YciI family protein n=1 Tax=Agrilactobacillus yilanensis TaxID=2485997 RepID=A0ABW4J6U1_9LACO|nr:YciI family protein [Agrilactobacillus yilanensis]